MAIRNGIDKSQNIKLSTKKNCYYTFDKIVITRHNKIQLILCLYIMICIPVLKVIKTRLLDFECYKIHFFKNICKFYVVNISLSNYCFILISGLFYFL